MSSYWGLKLGRRKVLKTRKYDGGKTLWGFSSRLSYERVVRAHKKEPMTQTWIRGFPEGSVFWDVGANVGVFAFLAASRGCLVVAIEPAPQNYAMLSETLGLNECYWESFVLCPLGLASLSGFQQAGGLFAGPGETGMQVGNRSDGLAGFPKSLATTGAALSKLLPQDFAQLTHLKIDVDGNEIDILESFGSLEYYSHLHSVLVELGVGEQERRGLDYMGCSGFSLEGKEPTVLSHPSPQFHNYLFERR